MYDRLVWTCCKIRQLSGEDFVRGHVSEDQSDGKEEDELDGMDWTGLKISATVVTVDRY